MSKSSFYINKLYRHIKADAKSLDDFGEKFATDLHVLLHSAGMTKAESLIVSRKLTTKIANDDWAE